MLHMDKEMLWKTILGELELEIARPTFKTFFSTTNLIDYKDGIATIGCTNQVIANTIETRYYTLVKQLLDRLTGKKSSIVFTVNNSVTNGKKREKPLPLFPKKPSENSLKQIIRKSHLNPLFTFDNFAVSGGNQMAYAASTAVAKSPGTAYNPLFLWGGVGVGKTHLMHAIGQALLIRKPSTKVLYCMGEGFTNEIVNAIQTKTTNKFKQKYRNVDILFIDDVQFIAGKNTVQEEFFHTFNAIYQVGGQIILTSDKPPNEIDKLEDRLRSRFEGGLTIDIQSPDFELRSAILRIKAQQRGLTLPMDVAQLIAANITDTRKLEGTLVRLIGESETKKLPISLDLAQSILGKQKEKTKQILKIPPNDVLKTISGFYDLKIAQIRGKKRKKMIVLPRQVVMYFLRTELGMNLVDIGDMLGGRDHTTIIHGVDKITKELLINNKLREDVLGIKRILYG